ncbi:hypothetical protein T4B_14492 [Trichinella pseudospiralis]|uniref:Uncharacterized protein n=1 Tax=Trichinella pseudospiralis TaxID=6337 RepID=A0A0V1IPW2_TRIPS|nr:hypothetical protein T4A_2816 [Trichinella pseudospiralis]KRZ24646.1 hypothetical protein T4B_14492 [Trichinella pseudospiralis]
MEPSSARAIGEYVFWQKLLQKLCKLGKYVAAAKHQKNRISICMWSFPPNCSSFKTAKCFNKADFHCCRHAVYETKMWNMWKNFIFVNRLSAANYVSETCLYPKSPVRTEIETSAISRTDHQHFKTHPAIAECNFSKPVSAIHLPK